MAKFDFYTPDGHKPIREIRSELLSDSFSGTQLSQSDVDEIIEKFWFRDAHASFISKEEIYPKFLNFLKKRKGQPFRRVDFYDYLFSNHPLYTEILALSYEFERNMSNRISSEEYGKLEKELSLHTGQLVAEQILFLDQEEIVLSHHTISEYFVAKDLLSKKNSLEEFQKFAVIRVPQSDEYFFNPSWYGVAHFLLDSDLAPELIDFFTSLAEANSKVIDQNYAEILSHSNLDLLSSEQKKKLFDQIYTSAKESGIWISEWAVSGLANLYSDENISILEKDLVEEPSEFSDILKTANVLAIMDTLLDEKKIIDDATRDRWKEIFIKYATQQIGNGVVQRRSLKALENFDEEAIIDRVKPAFDFSTGGLKEKFVQEAFLRLCYEINPNHSTTIEYVIRGFDSQARAYAWFGLQKITNLESILKFLETLSTDSSLLDLFLDDEGIFLKNDDETEERPFLQRIRKLAESDISEKFLDVAVELIVEACDVQRYYYIQKKTFIPTVLETALRANSEFWRDLLTTNPGEKRNREHLNLIFLLASVTNESNFENISSGIKELKSDLFDRYVYSTPTGIRDQLIKKFELPIPDTTDWDKEEARRKQKIIDDFEYKLEPEPKRFITDVFDYYWRNKKEIGELTEKQRERLLFLAYEDGVKRLDPRDFSLKINKYGDGKNFSWSRQAQYYGDMIRIVHELEPHLLDDCKQHLIDFIPFSFSDDSSTIDEIVEEVSENEISYLNQVYSDINNDRRYLMTSSYIYFVRKMKKKGSHITSPLEVLKSFVDDDKITEHDKALALETLEYFIDENDSKTEQFLKNIEAEKDNKLSEEANALLIKVFKDKNSINWRFSKLKQFAQPVRPPVSGEVRTVTFPEDEFIGRSFISPLVEVSDPKAVDKFLELLDFSFEFSKEKDSEQFCEYVNKSVLSYFEKIANPENYKIFLRLESKVQEEGGVFWKYHLPTLRIKYLSGRVSNA